MAESTPADGAIIDTSQYTQLMADIAERSHRIIADYLERNSVDQPPATDPDPLNIGGAFLEMAGKLISDPQKLVEANLSLWHDYMSLWQNTTRRILGEDAEPVAQPSPADKRFKDEAWKENEIFDFIKQSYLLSARWAQDVVRGVEGGMDENAARKVDFYTRQFIDAVAPSNFVLTNPEVLRATVESGGENLVKGLDHLLSDIERGGGQLAISMTDYDAFKVGENIAVTPGKVIYRNSLMELIQYDPTTEQVHQRPVLIVPPWINKYYILDLKPKNSFVGWIRDQGHTVFVISWVNPGAELAEKSFSDYMKDGPLTALTMIEKATGQREVNAIGYCLGGTLLVCTLAYMAAKGDDRITSATLMTTMTDFTHPGELGVFIDEEQVRTLEARMSGRGFLDSREMSATFNMLRANDLIWSFVINNYLLGKDPFPFDLLYWNADSTRMPAAMHSFYLRRLYKENRLIEAGGVVLDGTPIDLGKITVPLYMLSTREDHIAPWTSTFTLTDRVAGPVKFVLSASGHIAGVVNPPTANKYCYWTNSRKYKSPDAWLKGAKQIDGSWWPNWLDWISLKAGPLVPARTPGDGKLTSQGDAPGDYVKVRTS